MKLRTVLAALEEFYQAPYRQALARQQRDADDVLYMQLCAESLGVPNPVGLYTLELLPVIYDDIHRWHVRMNLPDSGVTGISCC